MLVVHSLVEWLSQTETWLYNQIRFLPSDIESHVVCEAKLNLDQFPWQTIHCLREHLIRSYWDRVLRKLRFRPYLGFLERLLRSLRPTVLHSHYGNGGWANYSLAKNLGIRHFVTFYGYDVNFLVKQDSRWIERYQELFEQVERVLCEGPHMAKCIQLLGCPPEKITVHHLGIDLSSIVFQPRNWSPGEPIRVLLAGSFREKKGFPYALEALGRFQKSHDYNLEITIIGDANDQPRSQAEKLRILEIIERYQLGPKVRFLGYQPFSIMLKEAYQHHLFISPSVTAEDGDTEGGAPVSIIEMAASGMPIITTRHCDIPEVILDGKTGLLVEERDVDGILLALEWYLSHPDEWATLLMAGRAHIEAEFDAVRQAERLAYYYANPRTDVRAIGKR